MTEHTGIVKSIDAKQSGNGKSYWTIAWNDGTKDNIFNPDWLPNLQKSQATGQLINFTREPTPDGKFKNIKSVSLATLPEKPPAAQLPNAPQSPKIEQGTALPPPGGTMSPADKIFGFGQPAKPEMSKADWAEKDKVTRKSIERQKALELAVQLSQTQSDITVGWIITTAKTFERYLAGEEVTPAINTLTEEAKNLGAEEIKKGENKVP
jgi:hypothetical protein